MQSNSNLDVGDYLVTITGTVNTNHVDSPFTYSGSFIFTLTPDPNICQNSVLPLNVIPVEHENISYILTTEAVSIVTEEFTEDSADCF